MTKKEEFKEFVKKNPKLVKYVKDGTSNWQQFYEIYDLYGEDKDAWKDYLPIATATTAFTMPDFMSWIKNIDLDSFQNGVSSLQRVLGVVQDLSGKNTSAKPNEEYKPRPMYKHFED